VGSAGKCTGWLLALACAINVCAGHPELRIQFAEKVRLPARTGHVEFDAYGRRFAFDLESNDRLLAAIPAARKAQLPGARLMRGKLAGLPGSWVRIARVGEGLEGAIWDGNDLYVVSSAGAIATSLTTPLSAASSDTVVFRLSDAINGLPQGYCGVAPEVVRSTRADVPALDQYKAMVAELRTAAFTAVVDQLSVALIADRAFQNLEGSDSTEVMLARLNTVDGIFSEQVGVLLVPSEVRLVPQGSDPFTQTVAGDLLRQLSDYRRSNPAIRAAGLAHLLTGKDLEGNTVGIAYIDSLCDQQRGASLSSNAQLPFYTALVMAHEFGHNFGADHDGEPGSSCATTPANYLMAPSINGSSTFSQCSRSQMAQSIARARGSCIVSESYADLAIDAPETTVLADAGAPFSLPLTARSIGPLAASGARVRVSLPPDLQFVSGTVAGGACSAAGQEVTCTLGDIASGDSRDVDLRLSSNVIRSFSVPVSVSASNDFLSANNTATVEINTRSGIDLGVAISVAPSQAFFNEPIDFTVDVSALRTQTARGGTLNIDARGVVIQSIDAGGNTCAPLSSGSSIVQCQLADLNAGTQTRVVVHGRAREAGAQTATAAVSVAQDSNFANNSASASYTLLADRDVFLTGSVSNVRLVIGIPLEITYTLTTGGRLPSDAVWLQTIAPTGVTVDSIVPSAGACVQQNIGVYRCDFGTLNPGDVRTVVARYRATTHGNETAIGVLRFQDGAQERSRRFDTLIYSALQVDAVAQNGGPTYPVSEGELGGGGFRVETRGIDRAQNVVATFEVPAAVRLAHVVPDSTTDPWQCTLETPQRGRCTGSFVAASILSASFNFESDIAGDYQGTLTVSATNDGDTTNNVAQIPIQVLSYLDVGVSGPAQSRNWFVGQVEDVSYTVTTGRHAVPGVAIRASSFPTYYDWETMTINGVVCQNTGVFGQDCPIGDLPANASVPVVVRFLIVKSGTTGNAGVTVTTARDSDYSNNSASFGFSIMALTDVQVSVAQTTATAVNGAKLRLPEIAVRAGTSAANDVVLTVTLPPFTTIEYVSANAICSGTTTIQCSMGYIEAGDARYFDVSLNTSAAGTFTSNVSIQAANDSNAGNNSSAIALSVTAPPPPLTPPPASPSPPSSGGGGGGGSLEWLVIAFLASMAVRAVWVGSGLRSYFPGGMMAAIRSRRTWRWRHGTNWRGNTAARSRSLGPGACRTSKRFDEALAAMSVRARHARVPHICTGRRQRK
jgi:reprolysin (M12B) family zinc metalloprotease/uncharacterized protein DUF11